MDDGHLSSDQIVALAADFNELGNAARAMLNDPNLSLTSGQSGSLDDHIRDFSTAANELATWAAQVAFDDSNDAFTTIRAQTRSACDTAAKLKAVAAKAQAVIDVLGAAVSVGLSFGTGGAGAILAAAGHLEQTISGASVARAPLTIEDPLWSGDLVPRATRGGGAAFAPFDGERPQITIGRPQFLGDLSKFVGDKPDAATTAILATGDFFVLRFACSFRSDQPIDSARFSIQLKADNDAEIIAYDLFPLRIDAKASKDIKVSFAPNLKFANVTLGTGSIDFGIQYDELRPTIYAEGALESSPAWVFQSTPGWAPAGTQVMHMVVKVPHGTARATADLHFTATIGARLWNLPLLNAARPVTELLDVPLWGA